MACSTSVEHVTASEATGSRVPTFSIQEFNDLVSSALDKDMSFSPILSAASHTLSSESRPLPVLPYYKRPRGFLQKLKNRVSVFKRRAHVRDTVAAAPRSPSCSTQRLALNSSSRVRTGAPLSPLLSAPPLVRFQSRSTSHRSFAPSNSSFASTTSTCEIKRTILTQFKLSAFRSHSKNSSSVSRRTISNPSPAPSSSLGCLSDFKTVRDLDTFDLDLEHPRQAPRPPTVSHSENMEGKNSFYFERELDSPEFNGILLEQPDVQMDTSLFSTDENKPNTPPRPPNLIISRPISDHSQSDPFSASSSPTAYDGDVNYISTPTPGTPKSPYIHHPYSYSPLGLPIPTGLASGSTSTSASYSVLPSPLSTMFFPLPPCSPPSLLEKQSGGTIGNIARAVSSTLSFGNGMREKGKGKKIPAPIKVEDPFNSLQKPSSKFGALLSRLSPINGTSGPSSSSSSFVQPSTVALAPLPPSSRASCASLIFTSDEESENMGSSPTAYSPLTPLDFTFGFGEVTQDTTAAHEVSVFEDDEDEEQDNFVPKEEDEDEQVGVDPFSVVHRPSIDSVIARFSAPSNSDSKPELEREVEAASIISSDSGVCCKPLPVPHVRRRPPLVPPPVQPLPIPPTRRLPPPPSFPPSSYSNDWTLALPFRADSPQSGFISAEKYQQMELQRMREIRNDWTLGLDLTLSAGMLMGDARGDGHGRGGRTCSRLPPRLREERRLVRKRSGSPFPLLERSRRRPLHAMAVGNANGGTSVGIRRNDGEMERAFQALLTDAGEGRLSQFGHPLVLPNENRRMSCNDTRSSSFSSQLSALSEPSRNGCEPLSNQVEETVGRVSVASTRTGPYYSARSSWQC
ncbi:hypothetical protein PILCRDRAFT_821109 [Piloderma croceum F 1598]|uniref:Uncharacterized protein n=1 Tax=Piloderma croceum (strain F 1598) TaxID=765440 RepID=A0A0C3FAT2_PILCF|nr:hypothetical protein PILCRDRAFT_821109 [Piloderma croceum F 1598]